MELARPPEPPDLRIPRDELRNMIIFPERNVNTPVPPDLTKLDLNQPLLTDKLGHHREGAEGFTYNQYPTPANPDGIRFEVGETFTKTIWQPIRVPRRILPSVSAQNGGASKLHHRPREIKYVTVKSYDGDDLIGERVMPLEDMVENDRLVQEHTRILRRNKGERVVNGRKVEGLTTFLRRHAAPDATDPIINPRWSDKVPRSGPATPDGLSPAEAPTREMLRIDLSDRTKSPLDTLVETMERTGQKSLVGVAIPRDGFVIRITGERLMKRHYPASGSTRYVKQYVTEMFNAADHRVSREVYEDDTLRKKLEIMNTPPNPPLTHANWAITRPAAAETPAVMDTKVLKPNEALELLCGPDVYDDAEVAENLKTLRANPNAFRYATMLRHAAAEHGTHAVIQIAEQLRDTVRDATKKLSIETTPGHTSISRALWRLAEQRTTGNDPFANTVEARRLQREIVEREIGLLFKDSVLVDHTVEFAKKVPNPKTGVLEERLQTKTIKVINQRLLGNVQNSVKNHPRTKTIINKIRHQQPLDPAEIIELGRQLRRSVSAPEED